MYKSAHVRGFVQLGCVGQLGGIGLGAGGASIEAPGGERSRRVGCEREQAPQSGGSDVQAAVQADSGVAGRHDSEVIPRARGVYCHRSRGGERRSLGS
eukprot:1535607-Pleurochrysis_carterae.AAC.1